MDELFCCQGDGADALTLTVAVLGSIVCLWFLRQGWIGEMRLGGAGLIMLGAPLGLLIWQPGWGLLTLGCLLLFCLPDWLGERLARRRMGLAVRARAPRAQRLLRDDPWACVGYERLAQAQMAERQWPAALDTLRRWEAREPDSVVCSRMLVEVQRRLGIDLARPGGLRVGG